MGLVVDSLPSVASVDHSYSLPLVIQDQSDRSDHSHVASNGSSFCQTRCDLNTHIHSRPHLVADATTRVVRFCRTVFTASDLLRSLIGSAPKINELARHFLGLFKPLLLLTCVFYFLPPSSYKVAR